jgi:hypothetical protein
MKTPWLFLWRFNITWSPSLFLMGPCVVYLSSLILALIFLWQLSTSVTEFFRWSWHQMSIAIIYHTSVTEFFKWSWHQCQCLYLSYICYRVLQMKLTSNVNCHFLSYICYRVLQMKLTSMSMPLFIIHLLQSSSDEADINVNAIIYHTSVTEFFRWSWHQWQCLYLSYICYRVLQMKLTSMSMPLFIIHLLQSSSDEANSAVKELSRAVEELQKLLKESAEGTVLTRCFCLSLCLVICHCFVTGYYCECGWNISKLNLILYRNTLTGSFVIY